MFSNSHVTNFGLTVATTMGLIGGGLAGFYIQVPLLHPSHFPFLIAHIWAISQYFMIEDFKKERQLRIMARIARVEEMQNAENSVQNASNSESQKN